MSKGRERIKAALATADLAHYHGQRIRQQMLDGDSGMTPEQQKAFWEGFNLGLRYISRIQEHLRGSSWESKPVEEET